MRTVLTALALAAVLGCGAPRDLRALVVATPVEFSPSPVEGSTIVSYPGNGPMRVTAALPKGSASDLVLRSRVSGVEGDREPSLTPRGNLPAATLVNSPAAYIQATEETPRLFSAVAYSEKQPLVFSVQSWVELVDPDTGQVHAGPVQSRAFCVSD